MSASLILANLLRNSLSPAIGADDVVLPKRVIPAHVLERLQPSSVTISGVNSECKVLGEFRSQLDFSGIKFAGIRILVTDESEAPPLIGRTVTDHASNLSFGRNGTQVIFRRRDAPGADVYSQTLDIKQYGRDPWNVSKSASATSKTVATRTFADVTRTSNSEAPPVQLHSLSRPPRLQAKTRLRLSSSAFLKAKKRSSSPKITRTSAFYQDFKV